MSYIYIVYTLTITILLIGKYQKIKKLIEIHRDYKIILFIVEIQIYLISICILYIKKKI